MRRVSVLGATGSIGQSTLDLIRRREVAVVALTGGRNIVRLAQDARDLRAEVAVTADEALLPDLRDALAGSGVAVAAGAGAIAEAAARPADWVCNGIVGAAGLPGSLAALAQGATLALANKESLVCAGPLMRATAAAHGGRILPVDSEHSALLQCLRGEDEASVSGLTLTASGGAFRDWPLEALREATPEQAATHPNWDMGQRITIDSASMFNKALELIEAHELFGLDPARIDAVIHPESIIHALVSFHDGAAMAHLGLPDMRHAIGHALDWPARGPLPLAPLDLARLGALHFAAPDPARYPALALAHGVMQTGGQAGAVLNAAKEAALDAFIARRIRFTDMAAVVARVLDRGGPAAPAQTLAELQDTDAAARRAARDVIASL